MERAPATLRRPRRGRVRRLLLFLAAGYLLGSLGLLAFGDALTFRPPRPSYRDGPTIVKLRTADGARVSARYLPNPEARYTLLFSHGQGDDLGTIAPFLERLHGWGYAVLAYDYEGYGTSGGRATEGHAYRDIDAAYDYLLQEQHVPPDRIIAYGYSLGSGPTVDLASRREVAGVVLDSAFTSLSRLATGVRVLPFDRFDNLGKLGRVYYPMLVIHRRDDRVVGFSHGQALYDASLGAKQHYWADRGGHTAIYEERDPRYQEALRRFAKSLPQ